MNIHEYQAKAILKEFGAPVSRGVPVLKPEDAEAAAREGFTGKLAIHPAQVPVINAAFAPSAEDVAQAEAIVAAFEAEPRAGVLSVGGRMVDRPHLVQAQRTLSRAQR